MLLAENINKVAMKYGSQVFQHAVNSFLCTLQGCFAGFACREPTRSRLGRAVPARGHAVAVWPLAPPRAFPGGEELVPFPSAGSRKSNQREEDTCRKKILIFLTSRHLHITPSAMGPEIKRGEKPNPEWMALRFLSGPRDSHTLFLGVFKVLFHV